MLTPGALNLVGDRQTALVAQVTIAADLSDCWFRSQVRLARDLPGPPLAALEPVVTDVEGIRIVDVRPFAGQTYTTIGLRFGKAAMQAMPFSGERGDDIAFVIDLLALPYGGDPQVYFAGTFTVRAGVTQ